MLYRFLIMFIVIFNSYLQAENPLTGGIRILLTGLEEAARNVDSYSAYTKEERENNKQIIQVGKKFFEEDGYKPCGFYRPPNSHECREFTFYRPYKNSSGEAVRSYIGLTVEVVNMPMSGNYPSQDVEDIYERLKNVKKHKFGLSSNILEKSKNRIVCEFKKNKTTPNHEILSIETNGDKLYFKSYLNEEKCLSEDEITLWINRFKQIPTI